MIKTMSASSFEYPQRPALRSSNLPYVEIVEQPSPNTLRFRYECERRSAGCIIGVNSSPEKKTYPTIKVHGYQGAAAVLISCVTKDNPPKPHPHSIIGRDSCRNGVCSMKVNVIDGIVSFSNLGIQCVKKKQVKDALAVRKREQVDPFSTGFEHMDFPDSIDLNAIRLCFQVFIQGNDRKFSVPLKPVATTLIYDKKAMEELLICKLSHCSAVASGGIEMILLCGKVTKDDIQIRFFEMRDGWLFWEGYGVFVPTDVHKQVAIAFKTPRYCNQEITEPVNIYIQLRKKSDGATSKPLPFQILPVGNDTSSLKRKRMKFDSNPNSYLLQQMQAQAEKQGNISNQALLYNFMNQNEQNGVAPSGAGMIPRPSPIFQEQAPTHAVNLGENAAQARQEMIGFNIPFHQQHRENEGPSQPHPEIHQSHADVHQPHPEVHQPHPEMHQPHPEVYFPHPEVHLPHTEVPLPQTRTSSAADGQFQAEPRPPPPPLRPRRRMVPPPPSVTTNSHVYREPIFTRYRQQESNECARPSYSQQPEMEMDRDDQYELNDFPCDIDELCSTDLAIFDTNSDNISETLSENLSKGLSISDQIQDTLQNIQELNRDVEASQQHGQIMFSVDNERRDLNEVELTYNAFPRQNFENQANFEDQTQTVANFFA